LYPNPARGQTTLDYELLEKADVELSILDASGRVIEQQLLGKQSAGEYRQTIHTYDWAKGLYLVRMMFNGESATRKLFIE